MPRIRLSAITSLRSAASIALLALLAALPVQRAHAVDHATARHSAASWLADNQNPDGSWGEGTTRMLVTAEAVLALVSSGEVLRNWTVTRRAADWLDANETASTDFASRRLRALAAVLDGGFPLEARRNDDGLLIVAVSFGLSVGPEVALPELLQTPNSYDTAMALAGFYAWRRQIPALPQPLNDVLARRRADGGWSGDFVPIGAGPSDLTVTAEILRAIAPIADPAALAPSISLIGAAPSTATSTLEVAARLAAYHAATGATNAGLEAALLSNARFQNGAVWSTDPFVNAMGLLALSTNPNAFDFAVTPGADTDGDGIRDGIDPDIDGDGVPNGLDRFPFDPRESIDSDADGIGDFADLDDDNDGIPDLVELQAGTDPRSNDSDRDGVLDLADACPLDHGPSVDSDGDGVCNGSDPCPLDPFEVTDLDRDGICDLADLDDDNDGVPDLDELAYGSDPRNASSFPPTLVASGDFDGDGLTNGLEASLGLSPYRADTDNDGSTDFAETFIAGFASANTAEVQPKPVIAVLAGAGARTGAAALVSAVTVGQPTPVAALGGTGVSSAGAGLVNLAGFQPQAGLGRDLDGDGLRGQGEWAGGASDLLVDSDGDGFVDGFDGLVPLAAVVSPRDLDGDGFVDGEGDVGTSPSDANDRPGKPGDVAPLGQPDGRLTAADVAVCRRIASDPGLLDLLALPQQREIALEASDVLAPAGPGPEDVTWIRSQSPAGGLLPFVP